MHFSSYLHFSISALLAARVALLTQSSVASYVGTIWMARLTSQLIPAIVLCCAH